MLEAWTAGLIDLIYMHFHGLQTHPVHATARVEFVTQ